MNRRVLVTGASGFIGGALCRRLEQAGNTVVGIGRRPLAEPNYLSHDLRTPIPSSLNGDWDAVVHAAARCSPWGRVRDYLHDNVVATRHVLDFCRCNGAPRLIYVSSSSVYYRPTHQLGLTEASPLPTRAVNPYAETKKAAEAMVRTYEGSWTVLRPRAVYGPGDTVLLPRIVAAARKGRLPIIAAGGEPIIGDLIYIDNLVDHLHTAVMESQAVGDINLTDNHPVAIVDFIGEVLRRLGVPAPRRKVSVRTAMVGAAALETLHWLFAPQREPA
ncbi:MAG: NAD(P)-dependent oxidoreductase, partial [Planctomycetota bacterium]